MHYHFIALEVNIWKSNYITVERPRGVIANEHIKIGSNQYEKVKTFKYLGSLLTNQNSVHDEIKYVDLNMEINATMQPKHFCFHDFSRRIWNLKYIILSGVLYGGETCSLTLKKDYRLRVFENWILRRIFELKRNENGEQRRFKIMNFIVQTVRLNIVK